MDQNFKVVQVDGENRDNFLIARAAYDTAVSLWPKALIELRQGAQVVAEER
jgi:hypothetical protein